MKHWVRIKFDYCGDVLNNHTQKIKTSHYYRENDDDTILHINNPRCINVIYSTLPRNHTYDEVPQEEFEKVLKDTITYMGINITNHKFIKDGKK